MNADIKTIFSSKLFRVNDYRCKELPGSTSNVEVFTNYSITFVRRGKFVYKTGRTSYDIYNGIILCENPNVESIFIHDYYLPDECTTFYTNENLLKEIAISHTKNIKQKRCFDSEGRFCFPISNILSTPKTDYLHSLIYHNLNTNHSNNLLKIELLILELLEELFLTLDGNEVNQKYEKINKKQIEIHLEAVERGKEFILKKFQNNINLSDIAENSFVSPFHFSRIFQQFTNCSPYRYLIEVRLKNALILLKNTSLYVTEICFDSGFNSLEHFIATFTKRYGMSPLKFRNSFS